MSSLTWAEISQISTSGKASQCFSVGDTKSFSIGSETANAEIIGFDHDTLASGGKAGITFDLEDVYGGNRQFSEGWTSSGFWGTDEFIDLSTDIYSAIESQLKSVIKPVSKKSVYLERGTWRHEEEADVNLFYLSVEEVFGNTRISLAVGYGEVPSGEGQQYAYYSNPDRRGKSDGWWLRSIDVRYESSSSFGVFSPTGSPPYAYYRSNASATNKVNFGFCV